VQENHHDSDARFLLEQLGGESYYDRDDQFYSDDDMDSGRVSPYAEMDVAQKFKESHDLRPRSIHHSVGGDIAEKSPSPSHQRHSPSPVGQLPSLTEGQWTLHNGGFRMYMIVHLVAHSLVNEIIVCVVCAVSGIWCGYTIIGIVWSLGSL
jgi:hypothetical protein